MCYREVGKISHRSQCGIGNLSVQLSNGKGQRSNCYAGRAFKRKPEPISETILFLSSKFLDCQHRRRAQEERPPDSELTTSWSSEPTLFDLASLSMTTAIFKVKSSQKKRYAKKRDDPISVGPNLLSLVFEYLLIDTYSSQYHQQAGIDILQEPCTFSMEVSTHI